MALTVGDRLGHYNVTALIGEGGMGQVYRATDTQLSRDVALKILPDAFAADPDRLARFQREAQVLASLNHPNIAQIHGIEKSDDTQALVLELVEGPTLADRIAKGPIPLDEALPIAKQIAEALEAAHEAGVIHRDLKPANIKVREDGTVKVLDFGLAKALDTTPEGDPSQSPTLTAAATQMGVILGTAAYMSPEQAKGKLADKRVDIWAFGVVLLEMLTGERPFGGDDVSDTLAAVLRADVDWSQVSRTLPPSLARLVRRCLERNPQRRLRDIGEARVVVDDLFVGAVDDLSSVDPVPGSPRLGRDRTTWAVAGGLVGVVVASVLLLDLGEDPGANPQPTQRFLVTAPRVAAVAMHTAISPDGQRIVYSGLGEAGTRFLFEHRLDRFETEPIRGTEDARDPFFSPDGRWVGFRANGDLKKMSLDGGIPVTLGDGARVAGAAWLADGVLVLGQTSGPLLTMPDAGGETQLLTDLAEGETRHQSPFVLPDGQTILFVAVSGGDETAEVIVYSRETGERRNLLRGWSPQVIGGHLVFARQFTLWAVPFNRATLTIEGDPVPVLEDVNGLLGATQLYATAPNGTLIYRPRGERSRIVWMEPDGTTTPVGDADIFHAPIDLSPDDRLLAVTRHQEGGRDEVVLYDFARGTVLSG